MFTPRHSHRHQPHAQDHTRATVEWGEQLHIFLLTHVIQVDFSPESTQVVIIQNLIH